MLRSTERPDKLLQSSPSSHQNGELRASHGRRRFALSAPLVSPNRAAAYNTTARQGRPWRSTAGTPRPTTGEQQRSSRSASSSRRSPTSAQYPGPSLLAPRGGACARACLPAAPVHARERSGACSGTSVAGASTAALWENLRRGAGGRPPYRAIWTVYGVAAGGPPVALGD